MKKLNLLFSFVLIAALGCAKDRPVEVKKIGDVETEHLAKAAFTGSGKQRDTWFHKVTVVKTSNNGGFLFAGNQSDMKAGYFDFTKEKLRFVSIDTPYARESDSMQNPVINQWPISNTDVQLAESDGKTTNREIEAEDKTWKQKRYFNIDFAYSDFSETAVLPYEIYFGTSFGFCWSKASSRLVDGSLKIESDAINYVVEVQYQGNPLCLDLKRALKTDMTFTAQYRYSFRKIETTDYQAMAYKNENDSMMKKFGFFQTVLQYLNPENGLIDKKILVNRWNPNKTHHFYFTKDFPDQYKWVFNDPTNGIFAKTNQLFAERGLKIRFAIHNNSWGNGKAKEFGDLRYSFIKIVTEIDAEAPLGFGPSDANPFTGEIIAANTVIWSGYLKMYIELLRTIYKDQKDEQGSSLYTKMAGLLKKDPEEWVNRFDVKKDYGKAFLKMLPNLTYGYPGWARFSTQNSDGGSTAVYVDHYTKKGIADSSAALTSNFHNDLMQIPKDLVGISAQTFGLFNQRSFDPIQENLKSEDGLQSLKSMNEQISKYVEFEDKKIEYNKKGRCVMELGPNLVEASQLLIDGKTPEDILKTILYRVSIHEFGHNLNLRHNFYGSVDKANFSLDNQEYDSNSHEKTSYHSITSSVMDYLNVKDEIHLAQDWENYDRAALAFAYSDGKMISDKSYLYCTDEHTILNALCNQWDTGTSPSEITMSLIKEYDDRYITRNYRWIRSFWDASDYLYRTFRTMRSMKKFLLLWRSGMRDEDIQRELSKSDKNIDKYLKDEYVYYLSQDLKQANKLAIAFYHAVIQQSQADRDWRSEYENFNGELKRIGIMYDKVFAMRFLAGDESFMYNPNRPIYYSSYLTFREDPDLGPMINTVLENTVTERVDMLPWFIDYGRMLYALSATNYSNRDDSRLIERIRVSRYDIDDLPKYFDLDASKITHAESITLKVARDGYFRELEQVGLVRINDHYYMISKDRNSYAYDIMKKLLDAKEKDDSTVEARADILQLYNLYIYVTENNF
jgi:hypothetical protein